MGSILNFPVRTSAGRSSDADLGREAHENQMPDLLDQCSAVIGSTIADRICELGGTKQDVQRIARAAAFSIFIWSAGGTFGR